MKFTNNDNLILINTKEIVTGKNRFHLYTLVDPDNFDKLTLLGDSTFNFPPKTPVKIEFTLREKEKAFSLFVTNMVEAV